MKIQKKFTASFMNHESDVVGMRVKTFVFKPAAGLSLRVVSPPTSGHSRKQRGPRAARRLQAFHLYSV